MRARLAASQLFFVLIAGACGGRLVQSDDGGSPGTGASPGSGGSLGEGASPGTGASSGRSSVGGTVASGGRISVAGTASGGSFFSTAGTPSAGGGCACDPIACAPGYAIVPNGDGCCFHCESVCSNVLCPNIACGSGSHLEVLAGQCCATCVQDNCEAQREGYRTIRREMLEKYSTLGCMTDTDCTLYYEKNQCGVGCGIAVPTAALRNLDSNLQNYAQTSCSPSCMFPVPPCEPPAPARCVRGLCQ
jgi:hypothetical protein